MLFVENLRESDGSLRKFRENSRKFKDDFERFSNRALLINEYIRENVKIQGLLSAPLGKNR